MADNLYIPQPTDMVTPAMNLYKLMQQKKEFELEQQKQGSLQDYHKQMGLQNKIQNIISLAKDQPEAAEQMFNSDPEMVQRNQGPIKFEKTEGDWHEFVGGDSVYKINRKTGVMEKGQVGGVDIEGKEELPYKKGSLQSFIGKDGKSYEGVFVGLNEAGKPKFEDIVEKKGDEQVKKNSPTEIRQWHGDAKSTLDDFVGTLTAMGIVIDDKKAEQYGKALSILESKRVEGKDPNTAASEAAKEAGLITSDMGKAVIDDAPKRFKSDARMKGNRLGNKTPEGYEVFDKSGNLIGHYE